MEKNNIKRWRKTLRSLIRLYHSVNNIQMKAKDSEFKEFSLLEYTKVLQENLGFTLSKNDLQEVRKQLNINNNKGLSM